MAIAIDEKFDAGTLGAFTATTAGSNTVAHSTDINHTINPSGGTVGSAKFDWAGSSGQAYIENSTSFGLGFVNDLWIRFYVYFDTFVPNAAKKSTLGGGADWDFFHLRYGIDGADLLFSLKASPDCESVTIPQQHFGMYGRYEEIGAFTFGHVANTTLEAKMWHRFWIHYLRNDSAGIFEWGVDGHIIGQTDNALDTSSFSPTRIRIGGINSNLGRPNGSSLMYVDDIKVSTGTDTIPSAGEFDELNRFAAGSPR